MKPATETNVEALRWPIDPRTFSRLDAFLMWTPFVGKQGVILKGLYDQLSKRKTSLTDEMLRELWKDKYDIAAAVSRIIHENMGWPTDRYIPDDTMGILLWAHRDGLDDVGCIQDLEKHFERTCRSWMTVLI